MHGWPHTWQVSSLVVPLLAPELRGLGDSDPAQDGFDAATGAADMIGLLDALHSDRAEVVALDAGVTAAFLLATGHPSRLRRLVAMEALLPSLPGGFPAPPWWFGFHAVPRARRVLLVEGGADFVRADPPAVVRTANWRDALGHPDLHWPNLTARLGAAQEPIPFPRGRGTGGSTLVNAMIAMRGEPGDYDGWARHGAIGWDWESVLPAFRRLEDDPDFGDRPYRGTGGPLPLVRLQTPDGLRDVTADELVLCAGTIATPALLQRSGLGPAAEIRALGRDVVADLPGVGANLADHPVLWLVLPLAPVHRAATLERWPLGHYLRFSSSDLRPTPSRPNTDPDIANDLMALSLNYAGFGLDALRTGRLYLSLFATRSVGRLRLTSLDPADQPVVDVAMLADPHDLARMRAGARHLLDLLRHPALTALGGPVGLGVHAATLDDVATDGGLDTVLRTGVASFNHVVGTCRMGAPDAPDTVVDAECRVLGVAGLRVVDASIMPTIPRSNTALPVVMLAEHAARRMQPAAAAAESTGGKR